MEVKQAFTLVLKKYREEKNLTQNQLAELCGMDRSFIAKIENHKRQPSITSIFKIAEALQISPAELVQAVELKIKSEKSK